MAGTRAQSCDRYGSGALRPGRVLGGSLPLLSPPLDVPTFAARCLYVRNAARDPSGERWGCGREICPVILPKFRLPRKLSIFYMPQIFDMGQRLYFPFEGRCTEDFFALKIRRLRPGLNPPTWVLKASTLPLDHRSRLQ